MRLGDQNSRSLGGDHSVLTRMKEAMSGDMVLAVSPATAANGYTAVNTAIGEDGFSVVVYVELQNANGDVHEWYQGSETVTVATDSSSGSVELDGTPSTVDFTDGVSAELTINYTGTFAAAETITFTVADSGTEIMGTTVAAATFVDTLADDS